MTAKAIASVLAPLLLVGTCVAADFTFINARSEAIEVRYWDSSYQTACGTLEPSEVCEVQGVEDDSHYCWQFADAGGRSCDPVNDGCPVDPGEITVDDSPAAEECRYNPAD